MQIIPRPFLIKISYWIRPLAAFYLKGEKFTDPIDGRSFRKFLPYGYHMQRSNVLAPGTLSLERHRLLWLYLQNETHFLKSTGSSGSIDDSGSNKNAKLKVLHMAPEQCFLTRFKKLNHDYITADLYSPIADIKADITDLPFENNTFDVIFCNHVLEHIPNDTKAMQELYRVMKPGGFGIFQVPQDLNRAVTFEDGSITDPKERTKIFGQYDHVRIYGRDYFDKLRSVGFKVDQVDYTQKITTEFVEKYRLMKGEILPVVYK